MRKNIKLIITIIVILIILSIIAISKYKYKNNTQNNIKKNQVGIIDNEKIEKKIITNKVEEEKILNKNNTKKNKKIDAEKEKTIKKTTKYFSEKKISEYRVEKKNIIFGTTHYRTLRSFKTNNKYFFLAVNLENNKTKILEKEKTVSVNNDNYYNNTKYKRALDFISNREGVANTGLKNDISEKSKNMYFTADFCPSSKSGFEKKFFETFISRGNKNISIAITKSWVDKHPDSFQWLLDRQKEKKLNITWVNHSSNHRYNFNEKDLKKNFLLLPNTDTEKEIFNVEKMLISHGELPSIFIRFPGLVSSKKLRSEIVDKYGLIFIGSDAWLAKGQKPKNGSIILIHGNKNEHSGIIKAIDYLNKNKNQKFDILENSL